VPLVAAFFVWDFPGHDYWGTGLFCLAMSTDWFDGRIARSRGRTSQLGSLLDPVADKLLVLTVLIVLIGRGVFPAWMVAAIVARELLVSGLRLAALERGVVLHARDLGKLKTLVPGGGRGDRRSCGCKRLERFDRPVGTARRARPDLGLRPRLRAGRARPARGRAVA
jgi:hypothetical protein